MNVNVRLFGGLTERVGTSVITVELSEGATVAHLLDAVALQYPTLSGVVSHVKVAVDLEIAADATVITGIQELALLPPVAGGADERGTTDVVILTGLVEPPIDIAAAIQRISHSAAGATTVFLGTVRDHAPGVDHVVRLDYSAYPEMAERALLSLAGELIERHPQLQGIALLHAIGELAVGDHTILIACSSSHRQAAFESCRDALELVKTQVPIWKREHSSDGTTRWTGLSEENQSRRE